jgi:FkbM family methyltransferase
MNDENTNTEEQTTIEEPIPEWIQKGFPSFELMTWFEQECDYHLLRNFDLNENSLVVDIGCYNCTWLKDMYCKYGCNCIGVEPITKYYEQASRILTNTEKVKLYNYGLTTNKYEDSCLMSMKNEASRMDVDEKTINVKLVYAKDFFNSIDRDIDVLQINIEGYEYQLLPFLMQNNLLNKVKNIQIQFHDFYATSKTHMEVIISGLEYWGFKTKFNYPFVWYGASK